MKIKNEGMIKARMKH